MYNKSRELFFLLFFPSRRTKRISNHPWNVQPDFCTGITCTDCLSVHKQFRPDFEHAVRDYNGAVETCWPAGSDLLGRHFHLAADFVGNMQEVNSQRILFRRRGARPREEMHCTLLRSSRQKLTMAGWKRQIKAIDSSSANPVLLDYCHGVK